MNPEQRRHPEKDPAAKPLHEQEALRKEGAQDEEGARAKSHRHKKVTADKWNQ
jgi:hypothetical protein